MPFRVDQGSPGAFAPQWQWCVFLCTPRALKCLSVCLGTFRAFSVARGHSRAFLVTSTPQWHLLCSPKGLLLFRGHGMLFCAIRGLLNALVAPVGPWNAFPDTPGTVSTFLCTLGASRCLYVNASKASECLSMCSRDLRGQSVQPRGIWMPFVVPMRPPNAFRCGPETS